MKRNSNSLIPGLTEIFVGANHSSVTRRRQRTGRRLGIETLESRMLLDAAPVLTLTDTEYDITTNSPWYIPLSATDADGDTIYYKVEVLEGDLKCELSVGTEYTTTGSLPDVSTRNPLWQLEVNQSGGVQGTMLFELFKDRVPNTVSQIMSLTTQNSYDGITFHRIIDEFMSQGGAYYQDGKAISGSYYQIDDEFDWNLRHTSTGVLSMAKSSDDTNTSQFFITANRCSWLDFQHSVFGSILTGQDVNESLNNIETTNGSTPKTEVVIRDAELVTNYTYSTLLVRAGSEGSGTGKIRVTAYDANGNPCSESQDITLKIAAESANSLPYNPYLDLDNLSNIQITQGGTHSFVIPAVDYLGNTYTKVSGRYGAAMYATGAETALENVVTCDESTGAVKIDTSKLSVGVYELDILVTNKGQNWYYTSPEGGTTDLSDRQTIPVYVTPTKLTELSLLASDDTGTSSSDGVTSKTSNLTFVAKGCTKGMTIQLYNPQTGDDQLMGEAVCTDDSGTVNISVPGSFGAGQYNLYAIQVLKGQKVSAGNTVGTIDLCSDNSDSLALTIATDELQFSNLNELMPTGLVYNLEYGAAFSFDLKTNQEEAGISVTYSLEDSPEGMTINSATGVISWTPTAAQAGIQTFTLKAEDAIGHKISQKLSVNVTSPGNVSVPAIAETASYTITEGTAESMGTVTNEISAANQILIPEHAQLSVSFSAADEDGDPISWSISSASSELNGLAIDSNGTLTWTAEETNGGSNYTVVVMASDGRGGFDTFSLELAVSEVSDPPVFTASNAQLTAPGQDLSFKVSASDPDASSSSPATAIYYELAGDFTTGMTCNSKTGEVTWSVPENCEPGVYTIQLKALKATVVSGQTLDSIQSVTVYVLSSDQYSSLLKDANLTLSLWSDTDSGSSNKDLYTKFNNSTSDLSLKLLAENMAPNTDLVLYCDGKVYLRDTAAVASRTLYFGDTSTTSASSFATLADGVHSFALTQIFQGETVSFTLNGTKYENIAVDLPTKQSSALDLTIDSTAPTFDNDYWTPVVHLLEGVDYSDSVVAVDNLTQGASLRYSLSNAPEGMTIDAATGRISWTPNINVEQTMSYTVTAIDLAGNSGSKTVSMSVVMAPELTIENQTINELERWTLELNAEGASNYELTTAPEGMTLTKSESGAWTLAWTPTEAQGDGSQYNVALKVSNAEGAHRIVSFVLTVNEVNQAPVIGSLADQVFCKEGELYELLLSATDSDLPIQDLVWSLESAPSGMTIHSSSGKLSWTPSESMGGKSVSVVIKVSDGIETVNKRLTFAVEEVDDAPVFGNVDLPVVFTALPGQIVQGTTVSMLFSARDPDYDTNASVPLNGIRYELVSGPKDATIHAETGVLTWTTSQTQEPGTYAFVVRAVELQTAGSGTTDGKSTDYSFDLIVLPKLELDSIESKTAAEGQQLSVQLEANVANSSGRPLTWALNNAPEGMTINAQTGVLSWMPSELQGGTEYSFTVSVSDASGSVSQTLVVVCQEVDDAPVFSEPQLPQDYGIVGAVMPGSNVQIQMRAADPDVPTNSVMYELTEGPDGCTIDATTGVLTWTVPVNHFGGTVDIAVRATEMIAGADSVTSIGLSSEFSFQLNVMAIPASNPNRFTFNPHQMSHAMDWAIGSQRDVLIDISTRLPSSPQDLALTQALRSYDNSRIFGIRYGSESHGEIMPPVTDQTAEDGKKNKDAEGQNKEPNAQPLSNQQQPQKRSKDRASDVKETPTDNRDESRY